MANNCFDEKNIHANHVYIDKVIIRTRADILESLQQIAWNYRNHNLNDVNPTCNPSDNGNRDKSDEVKMSCAENNNETDVDGGEKVESVGKDLSETISATGLSMTSSESDQKNICSTGENSLSQASTAVIDEYPFTGEVLFLNVFGKDKERKTSNRINLKKLLCFCHRNDEEED